MKNQNPLFSIIIPTHNRVTLLIAAIQSVIDQSFNDWEIIIIDDGSTDETAQRIKECKDPRIKYHYQEHSERSTARNFGISKAEGQYIGFLDDDDEYLPNHLEIFHQFLQKENFPKIILRSGFIRKEGNKEKKTANYDTVKHKNPVYYVAYNMCGVGSLCIPKEFLVDDMFPSEFPHWQDTHLFLRLLAKYPFHQMDHHTYIYNVHQDMGSRKIDSEEQLRYRAQINVKAIDDLFSNYSEVVNKYLPKNTLAYLKAEKWIQYANLANKNRYKSLAMIFFRNSIMQRLDWRLWKSYISFVLG